MTSGSVRKASFGFFATAVVSGSLLAAFLVADRSVLSQNTNSSTTSQSTNNTVGQSAGEMSEDLSGAYSGKLTMSGAHEMSGTGTLTITGNAFTLEMEGMSHKGRILAVNTRGYIGATLMFEDLKDSVANTQLICSVRVRKGKGKSFSMTPTQSLRNKLTFTGKAAVNALRS